MNIISPGELETVKGTVEISADASDPDDYITQVEFFADSISLGKDTEGADRWSKYWDTSTFPEGETQVMAVATDDEGKTASDTVTVTVDNNDPPTVTVTSPSSQETVSGTVEVTATASDADGAVLVVEFFVDGALIGTDFDGADGWGVKWDSSSVTDGEHTITAKATDDDHESALNSINVTVDNNQGGGMYVWDISWKETGPHLKTIVTIYYDSDGDGVAESSDSPVSGAQVGLTLSHEGGSSESYTGTTGSNGVVEFQWKRAPSGLYTAEITSITHSTYN